MYNKKYTVTKKNGGCVPVMPIIGKDENGHAIYDERIAKVQIPCGNCIECRQQKAREWQVRMNEEIKEHKYNYFITLTFSPEGLEEIFVKSGMKTQCNALAGYAIRHHLELWRKKNKCQLKHWYITELGHEGTERIHAHGIIFSDKKLEFKQVPGEIKGMCNWEYWRYGHVFVGEYCSERSINYIVKYINKIDEVNKTFRNEIFCSPGIGKAYIEKEVAKSYKYRPKESKDFYTLPNGSKVKLPTYYKNKFYNEEEREKIWRETMDRKETYIMGTRYTDRTCDTRTIGKVIDKQQEVNKFLGYGDSSNAWRKKEQNITLRMIRRQEIRQQLYEKLKKQYEHCPNKLAEIEIYKDYLREKK